MNVNYTAGLCYWLLPLNLSRLKCAFFSCAQFRLICRMVQTFCKNVILLFSGFVNSLHYLYLMHLFFLFFERFWNKLIDTHISPSSINYVHKIWYNYTDYQYTLHRPIKNFRMHGTSDGPVEYNCWYRYWYVHALISILLIQTLLKLVFYYST